MYRLLATLGLVLAMDGACGMMTRDFDFSPLSAANRIEIHADIISLPGVGSLATEDPVRIAAAARFFNDHAHGWSNTFSGGGGPLDVEFKRDGALIDGFGVGETFLTHGTWAIHPVPDEIAGLVRSLGVPSWPPN